MKRTVAAICIFILALSAYDVWTLVTHGYDTTVSWVTYTMAKDWPIIPFAFGLIFGHLFFPNRAAKAPTP